MDQSGVDKDSIHGIGFDATCSLVVLDADEKPVSVYHGLCKIKAKMYFIYECMYGNISDKNSAAIKISEKMLTDTCNGIFVAQLLCQIINKIFKLYVRFFQL